ncbi:venom carboxylesterase-6-like [Belonocnema kinseyi]|uniref:venom carboxylesterase-6-like n=1 Tax=Belonocnema kinseyi TaxID=2817044 RepID=UPI00143D3BBD|nr:venom carboxylesterase-6-like [Belonocnema kinseyi]
MVSWSLIIVGLISLGSIVAKYNPVVRIKNGTIEGTIMKSRKDREFASYRGIPYALPPLGELRFEPPKPAAPWTKVLFAKKDPKICTQRDVFTNQEEVVGDEDCLYLNVYTPQISDPNLVSKQNIRYPVMIWFHGGGWLTGAGNFESFGPKFLLDHELILVTVNYRLGPLGFLSTEDLIIPGNQGMKDQAQSIRWVRENILEFGGDPNRVTIFGTSAGGASVHYHMMSPLSKGLFHRGISQSGTALSPWALNKPGLAKKQAKKLAKLLECPTDDSKELLQCLRTKNHIDIIATDRAFQFLHNNDFLKYSIYGLFDGKLLKKLNEDFETIAPISLLYEDFCPENSIKNVTQQIREFYLADRPIDESTRFDLINMFTDPWISMPADNSLKYHLEFSSSPVYYCLFAYKGSSSLSKIFGDEKRDYGVCHVDEIQYLFPIGEKLFKNTPMSNEDQKMIDLMTSLWFNFANSGNPTPEISPQIPVKWKPVKTDSFEYLHIKNSNEVFMDENLWPKRIQFWKNLPCRKKLSIPDKTQLLKNEF